jgi:hypothetical protein
MITFDLHARQDLGEWHIVAILSEHYGSGLDSAQSRAVFQIPLTEREWDSDPLSAVLSMLQRWSFLTTPDPRVNP